MMNSYLLLLRDERVQWAEFSAEQQRSILDRFMQWNQRLRADGQLVTAAKLDDEPGSTVRTRNGALVVDGPFSEAKEAIGGFYWIRAGSLEEAQQIAGQCPILGYGGSVEVRRVAFEAL